jgi:hypothetical protein
VHRERAEAAAEKWKARLAAPLPPWLAAVRDQADANLTAVLDALKPLDDARAQ